MRATRVFVSNLIRQFKKG